MKDLELRGSPDFVVKSVVGLLQNTDDLTLTITIGRDESGVSFATVATGDYSGSPITPNDLEQPLRILKDHVNATSIPLYAHPLSSVILLLEGMKRRVA